MALVNVVSVKIQDYLGDTKTVPLKLPAATTLATINTVLGTTLPALDATIDGQIVGATVALQLTLPGGLKGAPVEGKDVHNGANLTFDPADTNNSFSIYIPTWEEAGFAGQEVLTSTVYGDLQDELVASNFTDDDGNTFDTYTTGARVRRK